MAGSSKFQNEDREVIRSTRITVQVRLDRVEVEIRTDKGMIYPATVVFRKQAGRSEESDPLTTTLVAIQKAVEALPDAVAAHEGAQGELW